MVSNLLSGIRQTIEKSRLLIYTYTIFLAGFYISPSTNLHRNFYYLFVLLPFLITIDLSKLLNCRRSNLFKLSILFLSYFLISTLWTDAPVSGEEIYDIIRHYLMLIGFILVTLSITHNSNQFFDKITFWLCFIGVVSAVIFFVMFYSSHRFPTERLAGLFTYTFNTNSAAMFFGFIGILSFHSAVSTKASRLKIFYWTSSLLLFVFLLLTQSRGPTLAFTVCLIFGFAFEKRWKEILIITILCIGFLLFIEFGETGYRRLVSFGIGLRKYRWIGAVDRILKAPLIGEGYFTDTNILVGNSALSPHNLFLLVTLKSGIIGGCLLGILCFTIFKRSYEIFTVSGNWIYMCFFVFFFICMTVDSVHLLHKPSLGWIIFWLPVSLLAGEEIRNKTTGIVTG